MCLEVKRTSLTENSLLIKMTTKQKCEKLAKVLETIAAKLRDPEIGVKVWESNEPIMQSLVTHVHLFLKKALELETKGEAPKSARGKKSAAKRTEEEERDYRREMDWPDILY